MIKKDTLTNLLERCLFICMENPLPILLASVAGLAEYSRNFPTYTGLVRTEKSVYEIKFSAQDNLVLLQDFYSGGISSPTFVDTNLDMVADFKLMPAWYLTQKLTVSEQDKEFFKKAVFKFYKKYNLGDKK